MQAGMIVEPKMWLPRHLNLKLTLVVSAWFLGLWCVLALCSEEIPETNLWYWTGILSQVPSEDSTEKVKVYLRVRPLLPSELERQEDQVSKEGVFKWNNALEKRFPGIFPAITTLSLIEGLCPYRGCGDPCFTSPQGLLCPEEQWAGNWPSHPQVYFFPGMEVLVCK